MGIIGKRIFIFGEFTCHFLVIITLALTHLEDRAMLESNPSARWGSAGDSRD